MNFLQARNILNKINGLRIVVLGDLMLDKYIFGEVTRISPEAPVPIVKVIKELSVLGGAANVAANLKAIGVEPILLGTIKQDDAGNQIGSLLKKLGISTDLLVVDPSRPSTVKTRIIGQKQQMLRIDNESTTPCEQITVDRLCSNLKSTLEESSVLVVSDYAKGVVSLGVVEQIRELRQTKNITWIVDPKPSQTALYHGATLMTPNTKELYELSSISPESDLELIAASQKLMKQFALQGLLVTRSEKGMALFSASHLNIEPQLIPTEAKEVFDVSGAGDTVLALFSAAISAKASWKDAAVLANVAAGIAVSKIGTAIVTPAEILRYYKK